MDDKKKKGKGSYKKKGQDISLGTGLAEGAKKKLSGRQAQLDAIEASMTGAGTITKKK